MAPKMIISGIEALPLRVPFKAGSKSVPLAGVHNIPVMPHSFYDGPGLLAAIHATAALGTPDSIIEWCWFDLEAPIYGGALYPKGGRITVPQGPGLGIDPDPDVVRTY